MGGSSLQCLAAFIDIYLHREGLPTISSTFRSGTRHAEEVQLAIIPSLPPLPPMRTITSCIERFCRDYLPLFPVCRAADLQQTCQALHNLVDGHRDPSAVVTPNDIPSLVSLYSVLAIEMDEMPQPSERGSDVYLTAAYGFYAHLCAMPYLRSVQALIVMSLALRCKAKDGQAWQVTGHAVRIAQSLGLHRYIRGQMGSSGIEGLQAQHDLKKRVWWSCYALEKLMELETGRPSMIEDEEVDQLLPDHETAPLTEVPTMPDFFVIWVSPARIMGQISAGLYRRRCDSVEELVGRISRLFDALLGWTSTIPESLRLIWDVSVSEVDGLTHLPFSRHVISFLSLQYYQAQIGLLRASVIFPPRARPFAEIVKQMESESHSINPRLMRARPMCVSAARAIIAKVLELAATGMAAGSMVMSLGPQMLATMVLALHMLKGPQRRIVRPDLELLTIATEHAQALFRGVDKEHPFIQGLETLKTSVRAAVTRDRTQDPASFQVNLVDDPSLSAFNTPAPP